MGTRFELHAMLKALIGSDNVYFQPPENIKLQYPCIIYKRGFIEKTQYANDKPYNYRVRYAITVIDKDPDSEILDKVASLPTCRFERHFTSDNLNHDIFNLYY